MAVRRTVRHATLIAIAAACLAGAHGLAADAPDAALAHPALWPVAASPSAITDPATEARITQLIAGMSVEEKVGQTIQGDIGSVTPEDLRKYPLGSILAGGNSAPDGNERTTPARWVAFIDGYRAVALEPRPGHTPIPILFGIDAVHGHNNIVGATIFPHNIGLGAARDPDLVRRIGSATAEEMAVTGGDWTFGPTLAVPRDERWGRSYEGYSEDPSVVRLYAGAVTLGLQGPLKAGRPLEPGQVVGSAKHFLGDGGTLGGKDQGDAALPERDLIRLHAQGYPPAIDAGVLTVMVSFSSWNGSKISGNRSLLTGVLKGRMGFQGFVVSDWNAHGQLPGCTNVSCPQAMNAGLDMYMAPDSWKGLFENTVAQVKAGVIPMARLDDAVRRILRVKFKAGLFDRTRPPLEGHFDRLGAPEHRALAREAVRKSLVLLKNDGVLPIRADARVLVAGDGADDIGKAAGGWTLTWQGTGNTNADFPHGQSIYAAIAQAVAASGGHTELAPDGAFKTKPDVAIVVFGENPYAEFQGDLADLEYQPGQKTDLALLKRLKAEGIPVVAVFLSGRPLWTNPEINASNAFVAAWLPGTEGGGIADVLIRKSDGSVNFDFTGRLSYSWPRRADQVPLNRGDRGYDPLFPFGYGLRYAHGGIVPRLSENPGHVAVRVNTDRYFAAGHAIAPWALQVSGPVVSKPIDADAQENARQVTWDGSGAGALSVLGGPVDLSRQTTGDMAVTIRYRVDRAPSGPVLLTLSCGPSCGASLDATSLFTGAEAAGWRTVKIKLSCFKARGADMARVSSPFALTTNGRFALSFTEIRLASNEGDAGCPGA